MRDVRAKYRRWREERQLATRGAIGALILALVAVAGIVFVKYDGTNELIAQRGEPATMGQGAATADPLAPANVAVPNPNN